MILTIFLITAILNLRMNVGYDITSIIKTKNCKRVKSLTDLGDCLPENICEKNCEIIEKECCRNATNTICTQNLKPESKDDQPCQYNLQKICNCLTVYDNHYKNYTTEICDNEKKNTVRTDYSYDLIENVCPNKFGSPCNSSELIQDVCKIRETENYCNCCRTFTETVCEKNPIQVCDKHIEEICIPITSTTVTPEPRIVNPEIETSGCTITYVDKCENISVEDYECNKMNRCVRQETSKFLLRQQCVKDRENQLSSCLKTCHPINITIEECTNVTEIDYENYCEYFEEDSEQKEKCELIPEEYCPTEREIHDCRAQQCYDEVIEICTNCTTCSKTHKEVCVDHDETICSDIKASWFEQQICTIKNISECSYEIESQCKEICTTETSSKCNRDYKTCLDSCRSGSNDAVSSCSKDEMVYTCQDVEVDGCSEDSQMQQNFYTDSTSSEYEDFDYNPSQLYRRSPEKASSKTNLNRNGYNVWVVDCDDQHNQKTKRETSNERIYREYAKYMRAMYRNTQNQNLQPECQPRLKFIYKPILNERIERMTVEDNQGYFMPSPKCQIKTKKSCSYICPEFSEKKCLSKCESKKQCDFDSKTVCVEDKENCKNVLGPKNCKVVSTIRECPNGNSRTITAQELAKKNAILENCSSFGKDKQCTHILDGVCSNSFTTVKCRNETRRVCPEISDNPSVDGYGIEKDVCTQCRQIETTKCLPIQSKKIKKCFKKPKNIIKSKCKQVNKQVCMDSSSREEWCKKQPPPKCNSHNVDENNFTKETKIEGERKAKNKCKKRVTCPAIIKQNCTQFKNIKCPTVFNVINVKPEPQKKCKNIVKPKCVTEFKIKCNKETKSSCNVVNIKQCVEEIGIISSSNICSTSSNDCEVETRNKTRFVFSIKTIEECRNETKTLLKKIPRSGCQENCKIKQIEKCKSEQKECDNDKMNYNLESKTQCEIRPEENCSKSCYPIFWCKVCN